MDTLQAIEEFRYKDTDTLADMELKNIKMAFYSNVRDACTGSVLQKVKGQFDPNDPETKDMAKQLCNCYALTMMDKVNWEIVRRLTGEEMKTYLARFDEEVREECKKELLKHPYQPTYEQKKQPMYAKPKNVKTAGVHHAGIHHGGFIDVGLASLVIGGIFWLITWILRKVLGTNK